MYSFMDTDFASWLEAEIKKRDWSQSDLSRYSGISRQVIHTYITRQRLNPETPVLRAIASAFRVSPETVYRAAGLLPSQPEADEMVEKLNYKITQLTPGARALAEKLLDALLEEDVKKSVPLGKQVKSAR